MELTARAWLTFAVVELPGAEGRTDEARHDPLQVQGQGLLAQMVLEHPGHLDQMRAGPSPDLGGGHLVEAEGVGDAVGQLLARAQGGGSFEADGLAGLGPVLAGLARGLGHDLGSLLSAPGAAGTRAGLIPSGAVDQSPAPGGAYP